MLTRRLGEVTSLIALIAAAACGGGSAEPTVGAASALDIISGNGQVQLAGSALPTPLTVRVTAGGQPKKGAIND